MIISLLLILLGVKIARANGKPGWKGGVIVAVIMYLILFWDWIPTLVTHKYLCHSQGGFIINKTLEEWELENPRIALTLTPNNEPGTTIRDNLTRYILNQRFAWDIHTSNRLFGIQEQDEYIVDLKTGEVIARYIDFDSGQHQIDPQNLRDFKFWLYKDSCARNSQTNKWLVNSESFISFKKKIKYLNGGN